LCYFLWKVLGYITGAKMGGKQARKKKMRMHKLEIRSTQWNHILHTAILLFMVLLP